MHFMLANSKFLSRSHLITFSSHHKYVILYKVQIWKKRDGLATVNVREYFRNSLIDENDWRKLQWHLTQTRNELHSRLIWFMALAEKWRKEGEHFPNAMSSKHSEENAKRKLLFFFLSYSIYSFDTWQKGNQQCHSVFVSDSNSR